VKTTDAISICCRTRSKASTVRKIIKTASSASVSPFSSPSSTGSNQRAAS
jgi:hypothetical protein